MSPRGGFAGLHVLVDDDPRWGRDPAEQARLACEGGARVVQLRAKHAPDREALAWAEAIAELCRKAGARFVVNDRADLAWAAGADAVHLGQEDLPPGSLPAALREGLAVGRSTHSLEQATRAADEDVDYVAFGPVFGTASKDTGWSARGVDRVAEVVRAVAPRPVVAIGGITREGIPPLLAAGVQGAAVISAVAGAPDPRAATRELALALDAGGHSG